jgi:hypothetical protein
MCLGTESEYALFWNGPNEGPWRVNLGISFADEHKYDDEKEGCEPRRYKCGYYRRKIIGGAFGLYVHVISNVNHQLSTSTNSHLRLLIPSSQLTA